ncbi:MAG: phytanoyl-CoA dioxygenase family protein [Armatimonadota bacterium]|nr:phytanoyl-CoA dioxygenase family protein [Armatimonadota bacterium]
MALTSEEKSFYEENGYLLKKQLIPLEWIESIKAEIAGIHERMAAEPAPGIHISWEKLDDPGRPPRILQLMHSELISPTLNRILRSDGMLDIVEALIGPDIALFHSKLLLKSSRDGSAVPWHQDYAYWKTEDNRPLMVNCQLAIDRATVENGCICFVPGSHQWGLQEHEREKRAFGVYLPGHYQERADAVPVEMEPGDGVFFSALIIHGSAPNTSADERRMNTFAYNVTGNNPGQCREVLRGQIHS